MALRDQILFALLHRHAGKSNQEAADSVGVCSKTISRLRKGQTKYPSSLTMEKILKNSRTHFVLVENSTGEVLEDPKPVKNNRGLVRIPANALA